MAVDIRIICHSAIHTYRSEAIEEMMKSMVVSQPSPRIDHTNDHGKKALASSIGDRQNDRKSNHSEKNSSQWSKAHYYHNGRIGGR